MLLIILLGALGIGLVLGLFTEFPIRFLLVPPLALAAVYWVRMGLYGDAHDFGRGGLVAVTGLLSGLFITSWVAGAAFGRALRVR